MYGTTSSQAVSAYVAILQQAVGCISSSVVRATGYRPAAPLTITLARGEVTPLTGGPDTLGFRMWEHYRLSEDRAAPVRHRWRVAIVDYSYTFVIRQTEQELLAFHWHPHVVEKPSPHVHLEAGLDIRRDFVGVHVPTGLISLSDVVRFAIEELRVRPRRSDWQAILDEASRRLAMEFHRPY